MKSHTQERGGVVSFIIITLALAGLLAGGLYLSKHQARVARDTGSSNVSVKEPETSGEAGTTESGSANSSDEDASSTAQSPAASTGHTSSVATTGPSSVAASGPTDVLVTTVGLMVLTATTYTFVASRRSLVRSALGN